MNLIKIKNSDLQFTSVMVKSDVMNPREESVVPGAYGFSAYVALNTLDVDICHLWGFLESFQNKLWQCRVVLMIGQIAIHCQAYCTKTTVVNANPKCLKIEFMPIGELTTHTFAKNLFVPLNTEYFQQFKAKQKKHELRKYGKRWNERTCVVGRQATLSHGYGKKNRLAARVIDFNVVSAAQLTAAEAGAFFSIYKTLDCEIAKISLRLKS